MASVRMRRASAWMAKWSIFMFGSSGKRHGGAAAERIDDGQPGVLQPVAGSRREHDVARLVFLGDPHRAFDGAHRAAGAVPQLQGLVGSQLHCTCFEFESHRLLLAGSACVWHAQDASLAPWAQTVNTQDTHE